MTAAAALACQVPPPLPPPSHPFPSLSCSLMSWQLMFVLWRTPTAHCKLGWKGHFNFSDSAWTVVIVLSAHPRPPSPSLPLSHCILQAALQTVGGGDWLLLFFVSFLLHPCSFAERRTAVWWIPIDPLNRPRNSSLHQAPLCWPGQHSTYKVDGLPCHTPHYYKWDGGSVAVTPPPFNISLHHTYLNIV